MFIKRAIFDKFSNKVRPNKVLILLGARRVGKTELINTYLSTQDSNTYLKLHGESLEDQKLLEDRSISNYQRLLKNISLLVIDEAQVIPEIGIKLKLIVDNVKGIKIIATGSSMFDLNNQLGEPLVGRKNTIYLFPFAQMEFSNYEKYPTTVSKLEERIIFGSYPELEQYPDWKDKEEYLKEIVNSYLLKDILAFDGIRNSDKILDLLRLIAFQVGKEVSVQNLGQKLGMSKNTVDHYLDLLSKVFIIFKIRGFSRNLRKEVVKSNRWFFVDNGIRNALIDNFKRIDMRMDIGDLWENYIVSERVKFQNYTGLNTRNYYWRTYDQQEIDWVEETTDTLKGFEFKWNAKRKSKVPKAWATNYPLAEYHIINNQNYIDWILPEN